MKNHLKILFISGLLLNSITFAAGHSATERPKESEDKEGLTPLNKHLSPEDWDRRFRELRAKAQTKEYQDAQKAMERYYAMYPKPGLF